MDNNALGEYSIVIFLRYTYNGKFVAISCVFIISRPRICV